MKNYERIKDMSISEMAEFFYATFDCEDCPIRNCPHTGPADDVHSCETVLHNWLEKEEDN